MKKIQLMGGVDNSMGQRCFKASLYSYVQVLIAKQKKKKKNYVGFKSRRR